MKPRERRAQHADIASPILQKELEMTVPVIVRLQGTKEEEGKK